MEGYQISVPTVENADHEYWVTLIFECFTHINVKLDKLDISAARKRMQKRNYILPLVQGS